MHCRFENRINPRARVLYGLADRIQASEPGQLNEAFARIAQAQARGQWVALILNYELGYWLEPAFMPTASPACPSGRPALTALVFDSMRHEKPWPATPDTVTVELQPRPRIDRSQYLQNVQHLKHGIEAGDFYQVNYTFPVDITSSLSPQRLYRYLANQHPSAYAAYIEDTDRCIASFSPELFVARTGRQLLVRPMKGTAPRHANEEADRQAAEALQASEKDRAENLMIVDLLRNDLGRVALPGSVHVQALFTLEKYPSVWTLTSTIEAQVGTVGLHTLLKALFPCGSVTGAPKIAAMRAIQALEPHARGIYCGSVGWLAPNGDMTLNVAIRTLELDTHGRGVYGVGGGIVHDSTPEAEWQECLWKARIIGAERWSAH